ncbi:hypothetical protein [Humidisolicoccus flavus]|uniref:hypothetical protein n=1 Tax=Humidisolicoccus flavus TaxID=3111414 RepID=UPI003253CBC3
MDPRFLRSRDALREAVLGLAAETPGTELTADAISRAAGVTRATLYRHAASPVALLADALAADLHALILSQQDATGEIVTPDGLRGSVRLLVAHIAELADVYRNLMEPSLLPLVRANLECVVSGALAEHLLRHPEILPTSIAPDDALAVQVIASFSAAGVIGVLELWLAQPELDIDRGTALMLAAAPQLWFDADGSRT